VAAPKLLLEDGSGGYQLEDASGVLLLDGPIDIALTGQKITSAEGTLGIQNALALSGIAATFTQGVIVASAVSSTRVSQDAGGRAKRQLYLIKVDGKEFATQSLSEALSILNEVKNLARLHAQRISREATGRVLAGSREKLTTALPKIAASRPLAAVVREVRSEIKDIYAAAFRDAEIAMYFEMLRRADEDEDEMMLLL